jgi:plasmid stabilization system protein ParE
MTIAWRLRSVALEEFQAAAEYYDQQRDGLGEEFVEEISDLLRAILAQPDFYPVAHRDIRFAQARRFPYCVYYRVLPRGIVIISVFHNSRDPAIWQSRS